MPQKDEGIWFRWGRSLKKKIIINDETLEQTSQFTNLRCITSYKFSNDVELKLAKCLQLIGTIKNNL